MELKKMIMLDSISNFIGIDLNYSDCGRRLDFPGKCARFFVAEHSTLISKITLVAAIIGTAAVALSPYALGLLAGKIVIATFPHLLVHPSIMLIALAILITTACEVEFSGAFYNEYQVQRQEQRIVDALGGKDAYDVLPQLSADDINNIHSQKVPFDKYPFYTGYLDAIKPHHVKNQPITVGVDAINRPFIAVYVKEKSKPAALPFVETFFQRHNPPDCKSWYRAGHDGNIFVDNFDDDIQILRQLMDGTHSTHELA
jgi:hypothetical protein